MTDKPVGMENEIEQEVEMTTGNDVAVKSNAELSTAINSFAEAAIQNLGGESLRISDLDRAKIPSGGGKSFIVSTDGKEDDAKEIVGTIVGVKNFRVYWQKSFEEAGGGNPPDCSSDNCITGIGTPGGDCTKCALGKFSETSDGKKVRPSCAEKRMLFIKTDDSIFPMILMVPPSALRIFRQYMVGLSKKGKIITNIRTKITLKSEKNPAGIAYSVPVFENAGPVDNVAEINAYHKAITPIIESFRVSDAIVADETEYSEAA